MCGQGKISLDWGAIFDILAIMQVKCRIRFLDYKKNSNYIQLFNEIASQIGIRKLNKIIKSKEYKQLLKVNLDTFNLVTLAQKDNGLARRIDNSNYDRYVKKSTLQKKFFNTGVKEIKIG